MAKRQVNQVAEASPRTSGDLSFGDADSAAATSLGIVLVGSIEERIGRAVYAFNNATRYAVEAGYLLLSVKADVEHGRFESGIEELGLSSQRASELMRMAKFATALPEERRAEMLMLPKSKVLALAGADSEVIADLLADAEGADLDALSVRELRQRIRDLQAETANVAVDRDTAIAERDGLAKQLRKRRRDAEDHDGVPTVVADARAEVTELIKKAELALASMHPIGVDIVGLAAHSEAAEWVNPSLRLALSGLVALHIQTLGLIGQFSKALGEDVRKLQSQPDGLAFLDETEIKAVAEEWARLTALHQHEAALRAHDREQAKPRGKGRPKAAPEAPTV
jgi:uncharacterized small protein (DUF1192 family)